MISTSPYQSPRPTVQNEAEAEELRRWALGGGGEYEAEGEEEDWDEDEEVRAHALYGA